MHTYLEAYHLHTHKKEKLLHKNINSYERQKGQNVDGIDKSKSLKKKKI